jgi:hypothetical protein
VDKSPLVGAQMRQNVWPPRRDGTHSWRSIALRCREPGRQHPTDAGVADAHPDRHTLRACHLIVRRPVKTTASRLRRALTGRQWRWHTPRTVRDDYHKEDTQ